MLSQDCSDENDWVCWVGIWSKIKSFLFEENLSVLECPMSPIDSKISMQFVNSELPLTLHL